MKTGETVQVHLGATARVKTGALTKAKATVLHKQTLIRQVHLYQQVSLGLKAKELLLVKAGVLQAEQAKA